MAVRAHPSAALRVRLLLSSPPQHHPAEEPSVPAAAAGRRCPGEELPRGAALPDQERLGQLARHPGQNGLRDSQVINAWRTC